MGFNPSTFLFLLNVKLKFTLEFLTLCYLISYIIEKS